MTNDKFICDECETVAHCMKNGCIPKQPAFRCGPSDHIANAGKMIEALLRGYIMFDVNGKRFFFYNFALAERKATLGDVEFVGLHIFKGWQTFYSRFNTKTKPSPVDATCPHCRGMGYDASGYTCTCVRDSL